MDEDFQEVASMMKILLVLLKAKGGHEALEDKMSKFIQASASFTKEDIEILRSIG